MSSISFIAARNTRPVSSLKAQTASDGPANASAHVGAPLDIGGGSWRGMQEQPGRGRDALRALLGRMAAPFREGKGERPGGPEERRQRRSSWWFLLPILLHAAGGIMAFFILRQDDIRKARNCLYLGLSLTALTLAPLAVLAALAGSSGVVD